MDNTESIRFSLSTLVEASSLLGGVFEDRRMVREQQDVELIRTLQDKTFKKIEQQSQQDAFFFAALDFLVEERNNQKSLHLIEVNGTGLGGILNLPFGIVNSVLSEFGSISKQLSDSVPVFLVPVMGSQGKEGRIPSKLQHERILYAQAVKEGFQEMHGDGCIITAEQVKQQKTYLFTRPTVVLGYFQDLFPMLTVQDNRLSLQGAPVSGIMHDVACDFIFRELKIPLVQPLPLLTVNGLFPVFTDKGITYGCLNEYIQKTSYPGIQQKVSFQHAFSREALIHCIQTKLSQGESVVIKPHAAGAGRGIDFFIKSASEVEIIQKVDESIASTQRFHGMQGMAFPYTVCNFWDTVLIDQPQHPLHQHKYELRVLVYREANLLKACPSIVKVAGQTYDAKTVNRLMLMNNVGASAGKQQASGVDFMLPLASRETLELLALGETELEEICDFSTGFIQFLLQKMDQQPTCFNDFFTYKPVS